MATTLQYSKVSEKHACRLAAAMHRELEAGNPIESSEFIYRLERLHSTGHDNRLPKVFKEFGLQADVRVSYTDIGLKSAHPMLRMRDLIGAFNTAGKIHHLLAGNSPAHLQEFWMRYKRVAGHDVFTTHKDRLHCCLPMMLHLDEGTSHKKKGLMILSAQIVCGKGSKRNVDHNFLGSSYLSRFLFSVLLARTYLRKKAILHNLLEAWASDLKECYENGIPVNNVPGMDKIYPVIIACKGDWPALTKAGRLCRHHLRDSRGNTDSPPGICHLCRAGQKNFRWNEFRSDARWLHADNPLPWNTPSPLSRIPQNPNDLAGFYAVDLFHVCHKGVVADYVASAIVPCQILDCFHL